MNFCLSETLFAFPRAVPLALGAEVVTKHRLACSCRGTVNYNCIIHFKYKYV